MVPPGFFLTKQNKLKDSIPHGSTKQHPFCDCKANQGFISALKEYIGRCNGLGKRLAGLFWLQIVKNQTFLSRHIAFITGFVVHFLHSCLSRCLDYLTTNCGIQNEYKRLNNLKLFSRYNRLLVIITKS